MSPVTTLKKRQKLQHKATRSGQNKLCTPNTLETRNVGLQHEAEEARDTATTQSVADVSKRTLSHSERHTEPEATGNHTAHCSLSPLETGQAAKKVSETFGAWYSSVSTSGFANELLALHKSQDGIHVQPKLISRCIRMHAAVFDAQMQKVVLHKVASQQSQPTCRQVSHWL